jgi:hypothetical protein
MPNTILFIPTGSRRKVTAVFRRRSAPNDDGVLLTRVGALEATLADLQRDNADLRREAAEARASLSQSIEFVLAQTAHTSTMDLIADFHAAGWTVSFGRRPSRDGRGTIYFEHPTNPDHNCTIDLPMPDEAAGRYAIENEKRTRIGWAEAA